MTRHIFFRILLLLLIISFDIPAFAQNYTDNQLCQKNDSPEILIQTCPTLIRSTNDKKKLERAFNRMGLANVKLGRYSEAISDFTNLLRINSKIAGYYDNRQNAYLLNGQFNEALQDANKAIQLAPSYAFVYRSRAVVYTQMQKYDLAITDYNKAIEIDPSISGLFYERGFVYLLRGNNEFAITDLTQAIRLDENNSLAYKQRGYAYEGLNNNQEAINDFEKYLQYKPDDDAVKIEVSKLKNTNQADNNPAQSHYVTPEKIPSNKQELNLDSNKQAQSPQTNETNSNIDNNSNSTKITDVISNYNILIDAYIRQIFGSDLSDNTLFYTKAAPLIAIALIMAAFIFYLFKNPTKPKSINTFRHHETNINTNVFNTTSLQNHKIMLEELEKLANLKDKGIITKEELEQKKLALMKNLVSIRNSR